MNGSTTGKKPYHGWQPDRTHVDKPPREVFVDSCCSDERVELSLDLERPLAPQVEMIVTTDIDYPLYFDEETLRRMAHWFAQAVEHIDTRARL